MSFIARLVVVSVALSELPCAVSAPQVSYEYSYNPFVKQYTRNVTLKQGVLKGVVQELRLDTNEHIPMLVEIYRGIPYAAPPVGGLRFMPTAEAPSWFGVKFAETFGPVCPQTFPDERDMAPTRKSHFLRLKAYLQNQSEDCLYLNIYAPYQESNTKRYPVIIFLHGESYEWNSGNPYDGSVLAAYGKVVVVTLNYRLGILGFLKLGTDRTSRANFALIDQIAALVWVNDNIAAFGGNEEEVTVMGHGTGAVSANLLMVSEMAHRDNQRLFKRAILMGGTALADWALAGNPDEVTYQVAKSLNCQIHDDFAECLRKKTLDEIMAASGATTPDFRTRFGPIVDSLVMRTDPRKSMEHNNNLFTKFELMYGVAETESINLLDAISVMQGMLDKERNQELRKYVRTRCEVKPELCLLRTLTEYGFSEKEEEIFDEYAASHEEDRAMRTRDQLLDMLSDALYVAPVVQTAKFHSQMNVQSYFYVFSYKTKSRDYISKKSYNGDEVPYVFGIPLGGPKFHFVDSYTEEERLFSEIIMTYVSNFANTGNPNMPRKNIYYNMSPASWFQFDVEWREFTPSEEWYLLLDIPPQVRQHYRGREMKYWNEIFPYIAKNHSFEYSIRSSTRKPPVFAMPSRKPPPMGQNPLPWATRGPPNLQNFENFNKPYQRPVPSKMQKEVVYGNVVSSTAEKPVNYEKNVYGNILYSPPKEVKQGSTINVISIIGGVFLMINIILLVIVYIKCYKKKKKNTVVKVDEATETTDGEKRQKEEEAAFLLNGCNIVRMMSKSSKSDETYAAVNGGSGSKQKLSRQMSNSTIDAHTKVRDWIAQEIVSKYSPKFFRRGGRSDNTSKTKATLNDHPIPVDIEKDSTLGRSPTRPVSPAEEQKKPIIQMKTSTITRPKLKPAKVSVAVDATPATRGPSVLAQRPIELTKSLDCPVLRPDCDLPLRRSFTMEDFSPRVFDQKQELRKSTTSIHLNLADVQPTVIKIDHSHSKSEPVQDLDYLKMRKMTTFDPLGDVNVTSKDETSIHTPLTPEESLMTIKRRNFPKVLPDHPGRESMMNKRRSMPAHALFLPIPEVASLSQPSSPTGGNYNKVPPAPPPRSSTLSKQYMSDSLPIYISEPALAEENEEEPLVCNTLYVGPLIPRKNQGQISSQPIYEKLRKVREQKTEAAPLSQVPIKRDPKIVVKPTLAKKPSEERLNKHIPRVVVPDNQPHTIAESKDKPEERTEDRDEKNERGKNENSEVLSVRPVKKSQIPTFVKLPSSQHKESSSSESTPSEESDTGTVVKKI